MITLEQARQIALVSIKSEIEQWKKTYPEDDKVIKHFVEFDDCWLFYINSRIYLETRNNDYRSLGGGPVIVGKENGDAYRGRSGGTEEHWVNKFREYMRSRKN